MKNVLFLTYRMQLGYGVDVVVQQLSVELAKRGYRSTVACLEAEAGFEGVDVVRIRPTASAVRRLAEKLEPVAIVAHTSPFFELLPEVSTYPCWAWEHGDPTPSLFERDAAERQHIKSRKLDSCYGQLAGVIAISDFIRHDIGWPDAHVIYNGCDHAPSCAPKAEAEVLGGAGAALRVGTLMRLGPGEARYKGNDLFRRLVATARARGLPVQFFAMGRGTARDSAAFERDGIQTHLNAPADDKWRYLRELDVFISPSLWEGFNLPLVEAQALGTVGLALDTGAHPEVTPFVTSGVDECVTLLAAYARDRALLYRHSASSYRFVRQRFSWSEAAERFIAIALRDSPGRLAPSGRRRLGAGLMSRLRHAMGP
jgi:glycosyltransferase involved in cell wall biosynthesis